ncbi:hypothetical protein ACHAXS_009742 [Conticribra weissflogii]
MRAAMNEIVTSARSISINNDNLDDIGGIESPPTPFEDPNSKIGHQKQDQEQQDQKQEADADDEEAEPSSPPKTEEFINTGLQRWEQIRHEWLSSASSQYEASSSSASSTSSSSTVPSSHPPQPQPRSNRDDTHRNHPQTTKPKKHAKDIDIDEVIDLIVSNRWRQQVPEPSQSKRASSSSLDTAKSATMRRDDACFPNPVSLPQMVDVLLDLWEAEGLDI